MKRIHNDNDLRTMLFQQPKAEQIKAMMEKLPPVPEEEKKSRGLSFIANHFKVFGMTRHKALYRHFVGRFNITDTATKKRKQAPSSPSLDNDGHDDTSTSEPVAKRPAICEKPTSTVGLTDEVEKSASVSTNRDG